MIYGLLLLVAAGVATTSALPPCVCTRNYLPVCGSDGHTYGNQCMFDCAKTRNTELTMARAGSCQDTPAVCVCTFEYNPVCGSDGQTYPNRCSLDCQRQVRLAGNGPCPETDSQKAELPSCVCTREEMLVCGTDGNTYSNPCLLNCATASNPRLSLKSYGPCVDAVKVVEQPKAENCACARNMRPVCGSDGKTYSNTCLLECAAKQNPSLSLTKSGPCDDNATPRPASACTCTRELAPVCGSDGETYSSACIMRCRNPAAEIAYVGPCEE